MVFGDEVGTFLVLGFSLAVPTGSWSSRKDSDKLRACVDLRWI